MKLSNKERVACGAMLLFAMALAFCVIGLLERFLPSATHGEPVPEEPVQVTKFSVRGPGVSWETEKTNVTVRPVHYSDLR